MWICFLSHQRAQVELGQVRQEIDRRLQEKEDEFNNARKVHQKTAEQMQAHLESECKAKAEVLRTKKKLEADIQVIGGFQLVNLITAELLQEGIIFLIHLFVRAILLKKKMKIEETKAT